MDQRQIQVIAFQMVADLLHLMAKGLDMDLDQHQIHMMEYLMALVGN
jgi:hypothetical protein